MANRKTSRNTYKIAVLALRRQHIHLRRFARHNFGVQRFGAQVDLAAVRLLDGDGRQGAEGLHLGALTIDHLDLGEEIVKDDARLLAAVHDHRVHLALDLDDAVLAPENVNRLLHVRLQLNVRIALVVLLKKKLKLKSTCYIVPILRFDSTLLLLLKQIFIRFLS